ncbi:hypothetical protein DPMN_177492 [Dreissena polymorpha]|uniref:Uncharacterized protein n=1 Tax=Dreissena polymorpha TaxID=45954 RepID=A0A9D4E8V4_DREPO|nr:hypothetical protein DPMN_177492 [Dreissena polymorpha]
MFCNDHSQLCCTNCAFLNHRQCAKVTLISESVKGPPLDLQKVSRKIQTILETLKKLENNWSTNMQSFQISYNKQLDDIRQTRQKINAILDMIEKNTIKKLDDMMANLKASFKTDSDNCSKLKNELKQLSDAIHDIVDKGKAELEFGAIQAERLVTFQADIDIEQLVSKLSGLGRIVLSYPDQVFTVQGKSEYNVRIPSDSGNCYITAICVLSSNQILVADNNNKCVKLLDQQYKVVAHCDLNAHPNDMCQITPSEVAVTVIKNMTYEVQFVSVNGGHLVIGRKLQQFQHAFNGIAHDQRDLYLTSGNALYKYSMRGDFIKKLYEDTADEDTVSNCAVNQTGDKILFTSLNDHKVITLARDGTILHTFTDPDLKWPHGIHVTAQGQMLVCGEGSNTILQLDCEGRKKLATLATSSDELSYPLSVCYNRSTASIIVGQSGPYDDNKIIVFSVQ